MFVCLIICLYCSTLVKGDLEQLLGGMVNQWTEEQCQPDLLGPTTPLMAYSEAFKNCSAEMAKLNNKTNPDVGLSSPQLIQRYGYCVELHNVTTDDGYILTVHRIPNPGKQPVYLQHGMGGCSDNWLMLAEKSLAFILSNNCFDVWLGNFRGTSYSLGNTDPNKQWNSKDTILYWDFSWHEMGKFDVPAVIKYIVEETNQSVFYLAHSMGTTAMLVAFSQVPDFINENVSKVVFLATTGYLGRNSTPNRLLAPFSTEENRRMVDVKLRGRIEGQSEWLKLFNKSSAAICTPTATRCSACSYLIYGIFGFDALQTNYTNVPNIVSRYPNTMSTKTLFHFGQVIENCNFCQYDYGFEENKRRYGSSTPPCYTFENVNVPVYAFHGDMDNSARPKDSQRTLNALPDGIVKLNKRMKWDYWTHVDFVIAKDADKLLYDDIIDIFNENVKM